jgi:2-amino-4-hydroxy-6-hydroxymethyldihydropteridine diphosphokinase
LTELILSLGSNIDADRNIRCALDLLENVFGKLEMSSVYESESVGFFGDNFLNLVAIFVTEFDLALINETLKSIEDRLGRDRSAEKFSSRPIDIDILIFGDSTGEECGIELPRAEILQNAFVLRPLTELRPSTIHAQTGQTFSDLWRAYDHSLQNLWPINFAR